MGSISGSTTAKCKDCKCVFAWHCESFPFVDAEFVGTCGNCIGTCGNCISGQRHYCQDETYEPFKVEKELHIPKTTPEEYERRVEEYLTKSEEEVK